MKRRRWLKQDIHVSLNPSSNIDRASEIDLQGREVGASNIANKNVVASLFAVAINNGLLSRQEPRGKDGNDTSFPMRVLARTINVRIAQGNIRDMILSLVVMQIVLSGPFAHAVGTDWIRRMGFIGRKVFLFTVDRAPGRSKDNLFDSGFSRPFEQVQHSHDIDSGIKKGIGYRAPHIHLCGMMIQNLNFLADDQLSYGRVLDISLHEVSFRVHILSCTTRQIINNTHIVASVDIGINNM